MCRQSILIGMAWVVVFGGVRTASAELVGYWNFDEGSGEIANDGSGNDNHGTLVNTTWEIGKLGSALGFDGASAYVEVPDHESLHLWASYTFTAWIYQVESRSSRIIDKIGAGTANGPHLDTHPGTRLRSCSGTCISTTADHSLDEWHHAAVTFDQGDVKLYLDGIVAGTGSAPSPLAGNDLPLRIGADSAGQSLFMGLIDDVQVYNVALTEAEILKSMEGLGAGELAGDPTPADGTTDVLRDVVLEWAAGEFAAEHDVYLGTHYADVNDATTADAAYMGRQAETAFAPDALALGTTYFWRIDEVNAAPDKTVFKGETWSFEVEPVSYPVPTPAVRATASSTTDGQDPNNTANGLGLNENDEHSNLQEHMWLGTDADINPSIQFEFTRLQKLDKVHVWNHNTQTEAILGFGIKEALIEYSADGATWSELGTVELAQATGGDDYVGGDVSLNGIVARFVKITGLSNHSILGLPQKGLAEVRFYYIPNRARELSPADGATTGSADVTLSWRAGREAAQHEVYLGMDGDNLDLAGTTDQSVLAVVLDYATAYFWQVVEVNEAETPARYESDVLSFATPDSLMIDDMEQYSAKEGLFIWEHWIDGFENPNENGAVVGNGDEAENSIVHEGKQSMPMQYNNSAAALSEATLQIENENWLASGIQTLSLHFHGTAGNTGQLYLKINDAQVDYHGDADDIAQGPWRPWHIDLSAMGGGLEEVTSLTLGVSGGGATGKLYIDDIRLYPMAGETITPVEPDAANLLAHYTFDGDFSDSAGDYDGTALGDARIVSDPTRGQVLSLDGDDDAVAIPMLPGSNEVTISMWIHPADALTPSDMKSTFHSDAWTQGDVHWRIANNRIDGGANGVAGGNLTGTGVVPYEQWSHVALTLSPAEFAYWLNGLNDISRSLETGPTLQMGKGLIGAWLNGEQIEREWAGLIDDVRFYNRALSEGEVLWLAGKTRSVDKPL